MKYQEQKKQLETELLNLDAELSNSANFSDPQKLANFAKQKKEKFELVEKLNRLKKIEQDIVDNREIIDEKLVPSDTEGSTLSEMAIQENDFLNKQKNNLENELEEYFNPKDPLNNRNVILEIRAGTGGDEAELFASQLFRMYSRFAEKNNWTVELINSNKTGLGGFKEVSFLVKGVGAWKNLKYESGVHRVQRVPETEKSGRLHTSAATVAVLPEAEDIEIEIVPADIKVDVFRSSGPGGQSVNTTDSAVRITYLPTNMVVTCQDEKSQLKNKEKAMKVLKSRLLVEEQRRQNDEISGNRKSQIGSGDRSEKIRTYNFPQDRITDHRIKKSFFGIEKIMDGELEPIIKELEEEEA